MNRSLRTSVWRESRDNIALDLVYEDVAAKSKWSVRVYLTNEQADSLRMRLAVAYKEVPNEAA
jgi:hypothetical protein